MSQKNQHVTTLEKVQRLPMSTKQRARLNGLVKQARDAFLLLELEANELDLDPHSKFALHAHGNAFGAFTDTLHGQPVTP